MHVQWLDMIWVTYYTYAFVNLTPVCCRRTPLTLTLDRCFKVKTVLLN